MQPNSNELFEQLKNLAHLRNSKLQTLQTCAGGSGLTVEQEQFLTKFVSEKNEEIDELNYKIKLIGLYVLWKQSNLGYLYPVELMEIK